MKAAVPALSAAAGPPPKRRRLPQSFHLADELAAAHRGRAATKIARFWRWRRQLRSQVDPLSSVELRPDRALRLVESAGVEHSYDALTLVNYFLRSGRFLSPLTRRELTEVELLRLQRKCPVVELRALLHSTYLARRAIAAVDYGLEIQRMTAHNDVGEALQLLLDEAEQAPLDADWGLLQRHLENYESALGLYAERHQDDLAALCQTNADIARKRGFLCPEALVQDICEVHRVILQSTASRAMRARVAPSMAFARLLRSLAEWAAP